jgi:hypothetical protein
MSYVNYWATWAINTVPCILETKIMKKMKMSDKTSEWGPHIKAGLTAPLDIMAMLLYQQY